MTSLKTALEIRDIILTYLDRDQAIEMFDLLSQVEGNKSFKDSIRLLTNLVASESFSNTIKDIMSEVRPDPAI